MAIGKNEVVEVLSDFRIRSIRFSAGPININVDEYARVADFINSGAITVRATKGISQYDPPSNTVYLKDGDPLNDFETRSRVLHECTHIISDINKARVTRLHDEATAYLAQFTFLKLLDPSFEALPVRGDPVFDLMRVGLEMVAKYGLGQVAGFGAMISAPDAFDLGKYIQRHPEYRNLKDGDRLLADGVGLSEQQTVAHMASKLARLHDKTKYDHWLISVLSAAQTGNATQKSSAHAQLRNHFYIVYKPVATELLHRLSADRQGDLVSGLFYRAFNAQERLALLDTLRAPKPPG